LRQIVGDPRRNSILFYNEICAETVEPRLPGESSNHREERALRKLGSWYHQHTGKRIILLSEQITGSNEPGVDVYSVEQYLKEFWPNHSTLQNLREVLKDAEIEEDLETIRLFSGGDHKKGRAVAGYMEVGPNELRLDVMTLHF
jgi:DIS3-like exonuclease 1